MGGAWELEKGHRGDCYHMRWYRISFTYHRSLPRFGSYEFPYRFEREASRKYLLSFPDDSIFLYVDETVDLDVFLLRIWAKLPKR